MKRYCLRGIVVSWQAIRGRKSGPTMPVVFVLDEIAQTRRNTKAVLLPDGSG
ncbi:hypothetical protein ACK9YZ_31440 [Rhizobium sp. ZK1]|uniref:hypothetical protein n=1 Tax=Rhizobium sp. ZK1 TaxID=3389872 RepID=UPI0039F6F91A